MAHNDEVGGSGGSMLRSMQLTYNEVDVLYWQRIRVPVQYNLPHGWHVSNTVFTVPPPPPAGPEMRALINERRKRMTPVERNLPANTLNSPAWPWRFEDERVIELAWAAGLANGLFNNVGRRAWWHGRGIDATLQRYGYHQRARGDPPRVPLYFPQAECMARVSSLFILLYVTRVNLKIP
jgi:hypothetical protein